MVRGKLVLPDEAKAKRERGLSTREKIELAAAKQFLRAAGNAAFEYERRRMLVMMFQAVREMNFSPWVFAFLMREGVDQLYTWANRAKAEGIQSLHPWRKRSFTRRERELLGL